MEESLPAERRRVKEAAPDDLRARLGVRRDQAVLVSIDSLEPAGNGTYRLLAQCPEDAGFMEVGPPSTPGGPRTYQMNRGARPGTPIGPEPGQRSAEEQWADAHRGSRRTART